MIKGIIFDFDGIVLESSHIKTEGFKELFRDYPNKLDEIIRYHLDNEGISRFVKFRHISQEILGRDISREDEIRMGRSLSEITLPKVLKAPFVKGAIEFLNENKDRYQFFIASGTPEDELRRIVSSKGLKSFFKAVYGSPKRKRDIAKAIMIGGSFTKSELVHVGDAESDRFAANSAGIPFIARRARIDTHKLRDSRWSIRDLTELSEVITKIECSESDRQEILK